ncbi:MAG: restriction endonuclease subunit R [Synechococcales bacterium]|nr:restriction endonuclease subunit R [Synechococcales bacterium]
MVQTIQASKVTLRDLIDRVGLLRVRTPDFFREWQDDRPALLDDDKTYLDRIQAGFFNLLDQGPVLERSVQIAVVAPLLFLAGFFLPPFNLHTEKSMEFVAEDEGKIIRVQIDILIVKDNFWVMVIESKEVEFSIEAGLAQLLSYMLSDPKLGDHPSFGLIATGGSFGFLKLVKEDNHYQYGLSRIFETQNPFNELYEVLQVMKRIAELSP